MLPPPLLLLLPLLLQIFWDYAPLGGDRCSGSLQPWSDDQAVFTANGTDRIGST